MCGITRATDPLADDHVIQAISDGENSLNGNGRVVIRKSGTEPLIRVMVEGDNDTLIENVASDIVSSVEATIKKRIIMKGKVLTIAGSDSSGGAGIQADIKTISSLGGYAMSAITAITVQDTNMVSEVFPVPANTVRGTNTVGVR